MEGHRVVVTCETSPDQKTLLREVLGRAASLEFLEELAPERRPATLQTATVLLAEDFPREVPPDEYPRLERVQLIQLLSAGADQMPFADLPPRMVIAANVGAYALPMAEHVLGMTLALAKRLCLQSQKLRRGEFDHVTPNRLLCGLTAGILGFGGIGRATARLLRALGMRIRAINTSGSSSEPTDFIGTLHDLETVLRAGDVVVISLPLTRATRSLIGRQQLDWMKPDAILINVSRGAILEEDALYTHVWNHPDFLLGLDAWWTEPFTQGRFQTKYPFLDLPNVLGSPHNSGIVPGTALHAARQAAENIRRYLRGEKVAGLVRREDYL
jgi:phosphoglycerate dehydrogenase-like enzyme